MSTRRWLLVAVVTVLVVGWIALLVVRQGDQIDGLKSRVDSAESSNIALANQVKDLGGIPVVELAGKQGEPGRNATDEQVADAVQGYLAVHPPAPGRAPTSDEIAAGVAAYCAANNCQGQPGANGTASDTQVASAVATFCAARNNCTGPPGPPGSTGSTGSTGEAGRPPSSFTIELQGNKVVECTPDTPPDPGTSPHYTCRPL